MTTVLECAGVDAGYVAGRPIVRGFDLELGAGRVTALLGPNGAGKTTVMTTLAGLVPRLGGQVTVTGTAMQSGRARSAARAGLVLVPDDRALFTSLTADENLQLAGRRGADRARIYDYFPALKKRTKVAAGSLSGGEQQMLAVGRALMQDPKVLLIDELSMGLAPVIVESLLPVIRTVADETGAAVLIVEQHVRLALEIADDGVVLAHGRTVLRDSAAALAASPERLERAYLGGGVDGAAA